jgi:hypothetical protein
MEADENGVPTVFFYGIAIILDKLRVKVTQIEKQPT